VSRRDGRPVRVVVCVKQVPVAAAMRFDRAELRLRREGVPAELNSADNRAVAGVVDWAASLGTPAEVIAITMGPPAAKSVLQHCLAVGCQRAVHLLDGAFAGSDSLATARTLAATIRRISDVDLVVCGRASTDAETGQVGPELGELLGWQQVSGVVGLGGMSGAVADPAAEQVPALRDVEGLQEAVMLGLPGVVTIGEDFAAERYPKRSDREAVDLSRIEILGADDIDLAPQARGQAGSPTVVIELTEADGARDCVMLADADPLEQARLLTERMLEAASTAAASAAPVGPTRSVLHDSAINQPDVWVVVDTGVHRLAHVHRELLGKAHTLSRGVHGVATALLVGPDPQRFAATAIAHGADRVLMIHGPQVRWSTHDQYIADVARAIQQGGPTAVLFAALPWTREIAARVAARLELGLTADCVNVTFDDDAQLIQHKPAFGDAVVAMIRSTTSPAMATVRAGMFGALLPDVRRGGPIVELWPEEQRARDMMGDEQRAGAEIEAAADLLDADFVVGVGMGATGLEDVQRLAEVLDGAVGCTRRVADGGLLPRYRQIGLTGHAIAPAVYLAVGVRGSFEHMCGVRRAHFTAAINDDPHAPVFDQVDIGICGNAEVLVPLITAAVSRQLKTRVG